MKMMRTHVLEALILASAFAAEADVMRVFRAPRYDRGMLNQVVIQPIDEAAWIWHADVRTDTAFLRFRKEFESDGSAFTVDVSADERFVLFLDGEFVARGPNRGWTENWQYQTYELTLAPGSHVFEAVVLRLGTVAPITQMSYRGGFTLKASGVYDAKLTTGRTDWQVGVLTGTTMGAEFVGHGAMGTRTMSCGTGFEDELPCEWKNAVVVAQPIAQRVARFNWGLRRPGWMLYPSEIPDQIEVVRCPGAFKGEGAARLTPLVKGKAVTIPPRTVLKVFWDLDDYYCYYPDLRVRRGMGAKVRLSYAESLVDEKGRKGNRNEWEGRTVDAKYHMYDEFLSDGRNEARFTSPWWRCGRWIVVEIETGDEPLEVSSLAIRETRYPCEMNSAFKTPDDLSLAAIQRICLRSMQCCDHEMLMDCPFYEQQMYPADTRVQMLTLTALSDDDRMIRRCMEIYDLGRRDDGLVPNNWPTRNFQESQVMSLNYLMMYGDYVLWHRNDEWLKARFSGAMNTLLTMKRQENADGLLEDVIGSPFIDWVNEWGKDPIPVGMGEGPSALVNLYYVHAMQSVAELAAAVGEPELADYWRAKAVQTGRKVVERFWVAGKGLLSDDIGHTQFSEHAQIFAILGDVLPKGDEDQAFSHLTDGTPLARVTVYSMHYLFEAFYRHGRGDLILARLDLWRDYLKAGLRTCPETPVTYPIQRSDCHAWGSHPIYHLRASVAGIRPAARGFARVRVAPSPGALKEIHATMPHPSGRPVEVALKFDCGRASGVITTPVAGEFLWKGNVNVLHEGENKVELRGASVE